MTPPTGLPDAGDVAACKAEVQLVQVADEAYYAMNDSYATSTQELVDADLLHSLPAYVGSVDAKGNPVVGGGTSTKAAPEGCP